MQPGSANSAAGTQLSVIDILENAGLVSPKKLVNTLQGSVWRCTQLLSNKKVVVKVTNKELHSKSLVILNGRKISVLENILVEQEILKYLSKDPKCPESIVRRKDFFESNTDYFLVLQDGGGSLFDFVVKVHKYIEHGYLSIDQWLKMAKVIYAQMVECIAYLHSKNICHFDISLENFTISNVMISTLESDEFTFCRLDDIRVTLIDFGLAEVFAKDSDCRSMKYCGKTVYQSPEITANLRNKRKSFNAKANDIWCLGISLFMMVFGTSPWKSSNVTERAFVQTMCRNGDVTPLLMAWNRLHYASDDLIALFKVIFKYEQTRGDMDDLEIAAKAWMQ